MGQSIFAMLLGTQEGAAETVYTDYRRLTNAGHPPELSRFESAMMGPIVGD
jgi:hypothetical protein